MNQTLYELYQRRSIRAYRDEPITSQEKQWILNAALQAPTAGNMALYSIIDVQQQSLKEELAKRCDHQPFIAKAPMILVFLADYQKWYEIFQIYDVQDIKIEESDLFLAMQDCLIAAQNAVVAAESLGIGSCYIGDILENFEANQKLFQLPRYAIPCTMVVFGKPTSSQKKRVKPRRFTLKDMVSVDHYHQKTSEDIKEMFMQQSGKDAQHLQDYIKAFAQRKFYADFHAEMHRSVRAILQHWVK